MCSPNMLLLSFCEIAKMKINGGNRSYVSYALARLWTSVNLQSKPNESRVK
jgi:hypothetical protein